MTAQIFHIRDYQNKKDLERLYGETTLEQQAIEIVNVALLGCNAENALFPPWPCEPHYLAPDKDPA